jgi:uncharacterized protein YabN with tetrapyrrole methylase and pyrophosphatase domain
MKRVEKGRSSVTEGMPTDLPSLLLSTKLQRKALSLAPSGPDPTDASTDLAAMVAALAQREAGPDGGVDGDVARLVGDVLFALADLARRLGVDPELALRSSALEFRDRVVTFEKGTAGVPMPGAGSR